LQGVIEAFRAGNYPSNQQIDETLRYVNDSALEPSHAWRAMS
jgi:hypothetical protein